MQKFCMKITFTAAKFIEQIKDKPEVWWSNKEVRDAVSSFQKIS